MFPAEVDLVILMPVCDDWSAVRALLSQFEPIKEQLPSRVHLLLVDDGSISESAEPITDCFGREDYTHEVLRLTRNLGHQQAIAVGLCHLYRTVTCQGILIMDADGEDPPGAIPRLIAESQATNCVVFASRKRRSEGLAFTALYHSFRGLHWLLTGTGVRVGNFSYVPWRFLERLVVSSDLWNHYAATIFVSRIPFTMVPVDRAKRLRGKSRMDFPALVSHGLSAMSVFSARVGARALVALAALSVLAFLLLLTVLFIRLRTDLAIPGFATYSAGLLVVLIIQLLSLAGVFAFLVLGNRSSAKVIPLRDYHYYISTSQRQGKGSDEVF